MDSTEVSVVLIMVGPERIIALQTEVLEEKRGLMVKGVLLVIHRAEYMDLEEVMHMQRILAAAMAAEPTCLMEELEEQEELVDTGPAAELMLGADLVVMLGMALANKGHKEQVGVAVIVVVPHLLILMATGQQIYLEVEPEEVLV